MCRFPARKSYYTCGHTELVVGCHMADICWDGRCEDTTFVDVVPALESGEPCVNCAVRREMGGLYGFIARAFYAVSAGRGGSEEDTLDGGGSNTGGSSSTEQGERDGRGDTSLGSEEQILAVQSHTMRDALALSIIRTRHNDVNSYDTAAYTAAATASPQHYGPAPIANMTPFQDTTAAAASPRHYGSAPIANMTPFQHTTAAAASPRHYDSAPIANMTPFQHTTAAAASPRHYGPAPTANMTPSQACGQPDSLTAPIVREKSPDSVKDTE